MDISIVIPAFNEAAKIRRDIEAGAAFIRRLGRDGEIIIVDDGSEDGTAHAAGQVETPSGIRRNILQYEPNRGKGYALRQGMAVSSGRVVMFVDSGSCIPLDDAMTGIDWIERGLVDLAHGSRRHRQSQIVRSRSLYRNICSQLFRWILYGRIRLPVALTDTQCGFKVYRGDLAREIYSECELDGFLIDIEVIVRAWSRDCQIREFPVHWTVDPDSRTQPLKHLRAIWTEARYVQRLLRNLRKSKITS